ncbi:MAG: hypothetical protein K6G22_07060 [Lachnospiraceae bacterium]|nr:hypothetical protein [Lachnospiraceae bacterium]
MSGPKLSAAEIERRRQEQLERERQEAIRKLTEARMTYLSSCSKIRALVERSKTLLNEIDVPYRKEAESKLNGILSSLDIRNIRSSDPDVYLKESEAIERKISLYTDQIESILGTGLNRSRNDALAAQSNVMMQTLSTSLKNTTGVIKTLHIDFSCNYTEESLKKVIRDAIGQYKQQVQAQNPPDLKAFYKNAVSVLEGLLNAKVFNEADIKKTLQRLYDEEESGVRESKRYSDKYDEYLSLCSILQTDPSGSGNFASYDELKDAVDALKEEYQKRDEMDYIADQINAVMADMGYSLVTSGVMTKKDLGETERSLYKNSERSGVAVYTDQSGAVMMRMTVLGDSDEITDDDRDFSYRSQIDFCSRHKELVKALAERGVYLKQKSYRSPNRDHTYKVNLTNGDVTVSDDMKNKKSQRIDRRARRRAGNKKMRTLQS